jgi:hypothetical protein
LLIIITTWLGAAYDTGRMGVVWHAALAYFSILFNLCAFVMEYRAVKDNTAMIREINQIIAAKRVE